MNSYLMFGHILQVRTIPPEQVHDNLFKNANRRFKVIPHNRLEARRLKLGTDRKGWEKRIDEERKRRESKAEKSRTIGYQFDAPPLRLPDDVVTDGTPGGVTLLSQPPEASAETSTPVIINGTNTDDTESNGAEKDGAQQLAFAAITGNMKMQKPKKKARKQQ